MMTNNYKVKTTTLLSFLYFLGLFFGLGTFVNAQNEISKPNIYVGIEVLESKGFDVLANKTVGLVTNPTGIDFNFRSTIDILHESDKVNLVALFGPEHGVRGDADAGRKVSNSIDPKTSLPVYSLYGKTRKPNAEMLQGIDVLVYDIQDIGVRSYTFISTMGLVMEAAAENDIEVVILDRPNPLGGIKVEGCVVKQDNYSFVSPFPIPYIYGLTVGELAYMINNEGWLPNQKKCKLTVIPMQGWRREMTFADCKRPWVPTSPHIPYEHSAVMYPVSGIVGELDANFVGIGYTLPFGIFAAEWINASAFAEALNAFGLEGVHFRSISFVPYYKDKKGIKLHGVQVHITDYDKVRLTDLQFYALEANKRLYPHKNLFQMAPQRIDMFDKVSGSDQVRLLFTQRHRFEDLQSYWQQDEESFKKKSSIYWMYR